MNKLNVGAAIETRGRIYFQNPSYTLCSENKKESAFKTLVVLADEATVARERLAKTVETGHPLCKTLAGMNCAEAISSLLAFTAFRTGPNLGGGEATVTEVVVPAPMKQAVTKLGGIQENKDITDESEGALELDDESFASFATFPGGPG